MRIGLVTSGGDCAGLNPAIRGVVRRAIVHYGDEVVGFLEGWRGVMENRATDLTIETTRGLIVHGGTVLKSSRDNPYQSTDGVKCVKDALAKRKVDILLVAGGDGSMALCHRLCAEGIAILGMPKTIDNDLPFTDACFGYDTAINVVVDALDRLSTTAESHDRIMVCEVMGNKSGWLAFHGGVAGAADYIFIPEVPADLEGAVNVIRTRHQRGRDFSVVVVAEGTVFPTDVKDFPPPPYGPNHAGNAVAEFLEKRTGYETRCTVLGHIQRGGTPTAFDRVLATRVATAAVDAAHEGLSDHLIALQGSAIVPVPLGQVVNSPRPLLLADRYERAKVFFG